MSKAKAKAKAPAPSGGLKGALANMDQSDKIKLFAACGVLVLAIVWILFYTVLGESDNPNVSAEEIAKAEAEYKKEIEETPKIELKDRQGRPAAPPSGS